VALYFIYYIRDLSLKVVSKCAIDPELDPGDKMGLGRPKHRSDQNIFKTDMRVGLTYTNPTQLERAQTNIVCEIYHDLFIFPNRKILMTLHSVQC
jgi:hypothetical protein